MILRDVAFALRWVRKAPGFAAVVIVSIALGIVANTTVFSMVNATLLGALPVRDASHLYSIGVGEGSAFLVPRLCATLFGIFGVLGLSLAATGLFGVVSYSVRSRTREIGIRIAVGADAPAVLRLVARQALGIVAAGLALGLAAAAALSRFTSSLLYGVSAHDAVTFLGVPAALLAAASIAVFLPARRACAIRPMDALRLE